MALAPGTRLGAYEVVSALGAGGMGEVYRARDFKLNRDVALKILPEAFTLDSDRIARFRREAQVLASLNHPNIAAIYGFEDSGSTHALVLELVEGPTLADRIAKEPIPLDEALPIAKQIAEALEAAHDQGIIHRDLKPANIKVRDDGTVKVLDFGLAKLLDSEGAGSAPPQGYSPMLTNSPTAQALTMVGVMLGTAQYMSPEQVKGRPADRRSDVWAFGCVVYEMLTRRRVFEGDDVPEMLAAVLERQPSWSRLPDRTPPAIRRLLRRCLRKDPNRRLHHMADARLDIEEAMLPPSADDAPIGLRGRSWTGVRVLLAIAVTALAGGFVGWRLKATPAAVDSPPALVQRLQIMPSERLAEADGVIALSPDGRRIVYAATSSRRELFVRDIDQFDSKPIPGTEGATQAAFSPDGQSLVVVAGRMMKKLTLAGGSPITLRESVDGLGLSWPNPDTIFFSPGLATGIWRIPAGGGPPQPVTSTGTLDDYHQFPEVLPNGQALLFSSVGGFNEQSIYVYSLRNGQKRRLVKGVNPHYLPAGYLTYVQDGTLFAVRFDADRLDIIGAPVAVIEGIRQPTFGAAMIAVSRSGTLAYAPAVAGPHKTALVWVDRSGNEEATAAGGRPLRQPRLAPDGRSVAVTVTSENEDVWLYDLARGTSDRLTVEGGAFPTWMKDGRRLTFTSRRDGPYNIFSKPLDGSRPEEPLLAGEGTKYPFSWSPDGRLLAFVRVSPKTFQDIWLLSGEGKPVERPFLETQFREGAPTFSPDGRWLAYVSDESGRAEVYARSVPGPGEKWAISADGGNEPVWPRDGRQLFYRSGDAMFVVDVQTSPTFSAGKPRKLFDKHYEPSNAFWPNFDVTADGRRLLMVKEVDPSPPPAQINVVLNWFTELQQRVPTR